MCICVLSVYLFPPPSIKDCACLTFCSLERVFDHDCVHYSLDFYVLVFIAPPRVVLDWFQFECEGGQRGRLVERRGGENISGTIDFQFMTVFELNDCEHVCLCVCGAL